MTAGRTNNIHKTVEIVAIIFERVGNRLPYSLERRKMNDSVNLPVGKKLLGSIGIAERHLDEGNIVAAGNLLNTLEAGKVAVRHIVGHKNIVAGLNKFYSYVAADIPGTSGN